MQKIEVVVRITKDHCPPQEQTIFEWFDLMRNPTDALSRPDLEINLEHHRVFKHGTEVYMSRYEYVVLSLMAQHPGKLFTKITPVILKRFPTLDINLSHHRNRCD